MKALVFEAPDKPMVVDKPMPGIKDTEVLVRSRTIGICHSDYELLAGRYIRARKSAEVAVCCQSAGIVE